MKESKKKIAVLGGGLSSLSTVFHLTSDPNWKEKYEITVYQMGWRLGGKCASGRNANASQRIEEHGIHVFGNFYNNLFHMVSSAYAELNWDADEPVKTMEEAFIPSNFALQLETINGQVKQWPTWLPHNDEKPWEGNSFLPTLPDFLLEVAQIMYFLFTGKEFPKIAETTTKTVESWLGSFLNSIKEIKDKPEILLFDKILENIVHLTEKFSKSNDFQILSDLISNLDKVTNWMFDSFQSSVENNDYLRRLFIQIDYYGTLIRGIIKDDIFTKGIGFLDDEDYKDWLKRHGLSDLSMKSPIPHVPVNICFQYPKGNSNNSPSMSAAGYLYFVIRQIVAKGAPLYKFSGGTGEVVIAPIYRVLKNRGVNFAFFHKVKNLKLSPDKKSISSVEMEVQATLKREEFNPLVKIKGRVGWPSEPDFSQLNEGNQLQKEKIDLESYWTNWKSVGEKVLKQKEDYDIIVLGISIAALPIICKELIESNSRWRSMVEKVETIQTQAFQIWLKKDTKDLGFETKLSKTDFLLGASYNNPFNDFSDFSDLIPIEDWKSDNSPKSLFYFCGPMQESEPVPDFSETSYPERMKERVKWSATQALQNFGNILPKSFKNITNPLSLDYDLLTCFDEKNAGSGTQRMNQSYIRANIDPTERYVLSVPGSGKYRLKAGESGFDGLILCGDWIDTSLNFGSAETSIMSGMLASNSITGSPSLDQIIGYQFLRGN
ncbi:MAG: NAD(P)-binding protein [Leptospiraceae bacterium]|nr:NAD(P)-binding protein [Leptospiraceae bacterium]